MVSKNSRHVLKRSYGRILIVFHFFVIKNIMDRTYKIAMGTNCAPLLTKICEINVKYRLQQHKKPWWPKIYAI